MRTLVASGQRLPAASFPTGAGAPLRFSQFRGRATLAVYLLPDDDASRILLMAIARQQDGYRERHAQPIAIVGHDPAAALTLRHELDLPFPVAADPEERAFGVLAERGADGRYKPVVALTDRYAEIRVLLTEPEVFTSSRQEDILEWLTYLDCLCSC